MEEPTPSPPNYAARYDAALLARAILAAALIYVCFFSQLGALGLVGPDEPRYASVARAMHETGDWITPRLHGQPWFEKPGLYYWGAALAFRSFGVNEFAARLPSALAALLTAIGLAWAARRFYGHSTAWLTVLIFPTSVGAIGFARGATPDMLFAACLAGAMLTGWAATLSFSAGDRPGVFPLAAFGALLGAAVLAKGPAAIVLAGGSMALWAVATRNIRMAARLAHPVALVAFSVVSLPWYVLCSLRNPDFLRSFLWSHNVERFLTPVFHHEQPLWFFGEILLLGLLPWTALLAGGARDVSRAWRERRWGRSSGFFFICWGIFPIVFFSFSKSKLPGYILPAIPPLVLVAARCASRVLEENRAAARWLLAAVGGTFVALGVSTGFWLRRLPAASGLAEPGRWLSFIVPALGGGIIIVLLGLVGRVRLALLASAVLMAGLVELATVRALPRLDPFLSPRAVAQELLRRAEPRDNISVLQLPRAWQYGVDFYLHRRLPEWTPETPRPGWVIASREGLAQLQRSGVRFVVTEGLPTEARLVRIQP